MNGGGNKNKRACITAQGDGLFGPGKVGWAGGREIDKNIKKGEGDVYHCHPMSKAKKKHMLY